MTGDQIAEYLSIAKPTIRTDLSLLVMLGYLVAKPKVGYTLGQVVTGPRSGEQLSSLRVGDVQSPPIIVQETTSVYDAVVTLVIEDVGGLIVADDNMHLLGVLSRKDFLKYTLSNSSAGNIPVGLIMTRSPNIVTVTPDDTVVEAARRMIAHQVDSLPVVVPVGGDAAEKVLGRITKTSMTRVLLSLLKE